MSVQGGRRRAREVLFRVVYQADLMDEPPARTWESLSPGERLTPDQRQLVADVLAVLERQAPAIDGAIRAAAENWEIERLAATDRSVLRTAVGELMGRPDTPAQVILNEAIELAKRYGSGDSGRFVNGVLDRVARTLRPGEL